MSEVIDPLLSQYYEEIARQTDQPTWLEQDLRICTKPKVISLDLEGGNNFDHFCQVNNDRLSSQYPITLEVDPPQLLELNKSALLLHYPSSTFRTTDLFLLEEPSTQTTPGILIVNIEGISFLDPDEDDSHLNVNGPWPAKTANAVVVGITKQENQE